MHIDNITIGKRLAYGNHVSQGVFTVHTVEQKANKSWFVIGWDKDKKRDISMRASQVSTVKRK